MTLQDIFDKLVADREVTCAVTKKQSETLRVGLIRKWDTYYDMWNKVGYLDEDLLDCRVGRLTVKSDEVYKFTLAPKVVTVQNYTIIETGETNAPV